MTVRPRNVGTFLIARPETSAKLSARARMRSMSSRERSAIEIRWRFNSGPPAPGGPNDEIRRQPSASPGAPVHGHGRLGFRNFSDGHFIHPVQFLDADVH